jgi:TonB family protein
MTALTPLLLKVLLIALPLSLTGWLVTRLLKQGPAQRRRSLITLVMSALLLLPILVWVGPRLLEITLPPPEATAPMYISFSQSLVVSETVTAKPGLTWLDWSLVVWLGGALLGSLVLAWGILGVWLHIRRSSPLTTIQMKNLAQTLPDPGDLPLNRVRLSNRIKGPAAAGFFRPWILIPTRLFEHLDAAELQAVLAHETAHIHNRDSLFTLLGRLASLFYWWNPLVRMLSQERERIQELIGDQAAARRSGELDYAKALLSLAEKSCYDPSLRGVLAFFGPLPLKERIERILFKEEIMNKRKWQKGVLFAGSLAMAVMLAAAGTEFVRETTAGESEPAPAIASGETTAAQVDEPPLRVDKLKQPTLIKRVQPEYPEEAKKNRVTSQVILAATTNEKGEVAKVDVISGHPLFNDAAVNALKQWLYEPYLVDGKPKPVQFTVILTFKLGDTDDQEPIRVRSIGQPVLIKRVEPEYPQAALDARLQGQVFIEATTDIYGRVAKAVHIAGDKDPKAPEYQQLVDAAVMAVKQWVYEPYIINGRPKAVTFTVIMTFKLGKDKKEKPTN